MSAVVESPISPLPWWRRLTQWLERYGQGWLIFALFAALYLTGSQVNLQGQLERIRSYTRPLEFNAVGWMARAWLVKGAFLLLAPERYLTLEDQKQLVLNYRELVHTLQQYEHELQRAYGDPNLPNREERIAQLQAKLAQLRQRQRRLAPVIEQILQSQIAAVLVDLGFGYAGALFPPVVYRESTLPNALVISPRHVIRQDALITLDPGVPFERQVEVEEEVAQDLDLSTLVVPIGGLATYPTMIMQTTDLRWLLDTIAHEWIHTYFDTRPLGWAYFTGDPAMRTINETAASIGGREIGRLTLERFYPELAPPPPPKPKSRPEPAAKTQATPTPTPTPVFDFNREMRKTRIRVDQLLAEGRIEEAEAYMEERRKVFWEHGYRIRKLNQAYFAFYGSYADAPGGGAAGDDPVGAAVRAFWNQTQDVAVFLKRIAMVWSFEQLLQMVEQGGN